MRRFLRTPKPVQVPDRQTPSECQRVAKRAKEGINAERGALFQVVACVEVIKESTGCDQNRPTIEQDREQHDEQLATNNIRSCFVS